MARSAIWMHICCVIAAGMLAATAGVANAKQCVWNKSGFLLRVLWYTPSHSIIYSKSRKTGKVTFHMKKNAKLVQRDVFPTMQGRCTRGAYQDKTLEAVLQVVGGKLASDATKIGVDAAAAAAGAAACVGSAGAECPAAAAAAAGAAAAANGAIPDGKDIIRVLVPPRTRYVDVWGTVWNPQVGLGGPIH